MEHSNLGFRHHVSVYWLWLSSFPLTRTLWLYWAHLNNPGVSKFQDFQSLFPCEINTLMGCCDWDTDLFGEVGQYSAHQRLQQHLRFLPALAAIFIWWESESEVAQSCPTLCDPMDCSPADSLVHGIFQAWILEWVAISFSRGSSRPRDQTRVSHIVGRCFTVWATRGDFDGKEVHKWMMAKYDCK